MPGIPAYSRATLPPHASRKPVLDELRTQRAVGVRHEVRAQSGGHRRPVTLEPGRCHLGHAEHLLLSSVE